MEDRTDLSRLLAGDAAAEDLARSLSTARARELTPRLLRRLHELEPGTPAYSRLRSVVITCNLSLVRALLRRFATSQVPREDLMQVGVVGLIKAVDRFDPLRGMQFSTFAVPTIEGEIKRHLRDTTWHAHVPRGVQENHLRVQRTREGLAARLGRSPDLTELTEATGLTPAEIREADTAAQARTSGSLEPGADESTLGLVRRLGDSDPELEKCEALIALKPALARLDDRERTILELRFGAELTQKQIGRHLGISQMHVSRILNRILEQLRPALLPTN